MGIARIASGLALFATASACTLLSGASDLRIGGDTTGGDPDGSIASGDGSADGTTTPDGAPPSSDLFFIATQIADGARLAAPGVLSLNGGPPRSVGCASATVAEVFQPSPPAGGPGSTVANGPYLVGHLTSRANSTTFLYLDEAPSGNAAQLLAATATTDCNTNRPVRVDRDAVTNGAPSLPRFNPSGTRVAYLLQTGGQAIRRVATTPASGMGTANILRRDTDFAPSNGGGIWFAPPVWLAEDELVWVEYTNAPQAPFPLSLKRAKDSATPMVQTVSSCSRYIEQIEIFMRGGETRVAVVSSDGTWGQQQAGISTMLGVHTLAQGCAAATPLVPSAPAGTVARDAAVAPGGMLIAFAANLDAPAASRSLNSPMNVWLVDSTGATAPVRCSGQDASFDEIGPQWLEGGAKLAWMRMGRGSSNDERSIWIADVAGGACSNARPLLEGKGSAPRYLTGANAGLACGVALLGAPHHGFLSGALLFVLLGLARRRASGRRFGR